MRLLIISDIHYPIGSIEEVKRIIKKVEPDNLALLGDNIDNIEGHGALKLYKRFIARLSSAFPINRTILMLGDEDYFFQGDKEKVMRYVKSLRTLNREHLIFRKGNMVFSHGNVERSRHLEGIGKKIVLFSVSKGVHNAIPFLVAFWARVSLHVRRGDYLFLGHIHFLGKSRTNKATFCGTLNRKANFFAERSIGYVIVEHEAFTLNSMDEISTVSINRQSSAKTA